MRPNYRKWLKMGVELEGGWNENYKVVAERVSGAQGKTDGSVKNTGGYYNGEIITRPHESLEKLCEDVKLLYPQHVNNTCGLHIHTSFSPMNMSILADKDFWNYFRARWKAWGNVYAGDNKLFWDRYNGITPADGQQQYCKADFKPLQQLQDHNDRYTQLNFCAWSKYKTLECRMLPMFTDVDVTISAIRELSDIFDSYLNTNSYPLIKLDHDVIIDSTGVQEIYTSVAPSRELITEMQTRELPKVAVGNDMFYDIPGAEGLMVRPPPYSNLSLAIFDIP